MSGLAAIINFDGAPVAQGAIEAMTRAMWRRGPDGVAHWIEGSAALGHCMFRTTPESLGERQPHCDETGDNVLVMDGRLDNFEELRKTLLASGARLRDRSDAELVLKAYGIWGENCPARLDGDFAFAVFDKRRRVLFCARDHLGAKPLYYHCEGRSLVVASDLAAVVAARAESPGVNRGMIAELLAGEWLSLDETIFTGVMRLVAAHRLRADADGMRVERYWTPPQDRLLRYKRDEEYFEHYREVFTESVRRSARAAAPVAIEVSGGLDSSAVFCMAERLSAQGRLPAPAIRGYALAFEAEDDDNELEYIRAVRDHLGVPIRELAPSLHPLAWFDERAREMQDFPGFPNAAMFCGIRRAMTADGCRVVLNGEGGDEWLSGSPLHYAEDLALGAWRAVAESFRADIAAYGPARSLYSVLRHGLFHLLPVPVKTIARRYGRTSQPEEHGGGYWLSRDLCELLAERRALASLRNSEQPSREGLRALLARLNNPFAAYLKESGDRDAAWFGVEARSPMQRRAFVELALATPDHMRLRGGVNKYLHVKALAGILPPRIATRRGKADFSFVFQQYLDEMQEVLTRTLPHERPDLVDAAGMTRLYETYRAGAAQGAPNWELWGVLACRTLPRGDF